MNRPAKFFVAGALTLAGCGQPNAPVANSGGGNGGLVQPAQVADGSAVTFVSLKVPNMF